MLEIGDFGLDFSVFNEKWLIRSTSSGQVFVDFFVIVFGLMPTEKNR